MVQFSIYLNRRVFIMCRALAHMSEQTVYTSLDQNILGHRLSLVFLMYVIHFANILQPSFFFSFKFKWSILGTCLTTFPLKSSKQEKEQAVMQQSKKKFLTSTDVESNSSRLRDNLAHYCIWLHMILS